MWSPLPKTQRRIKTLRHSPCDDTPYAATATVAVRTCGLWLLGSKNIFFVSILHIAVHGRSGSPHQNRPHIFQALNAETDFLKFKAKD